MNESFGYFFTNLTWGSMPQKHWSKGVEQGEGPGGINVVGRQQRRRDTKPVTDTANVKACQWEFDLPT